MSPDAELRISPTPDEADDTTYMMSSKLRNKRAASKPKSQTAAKRAKKASLPQETTSPADGNNVHQGPDDGEQSLRPPSRAPSLDNGSPLSQATMSDDPETQPPTPPAALANTHPDFTDVNYVPYVKLQRLATFAQKVDDENNRFAVSHIPASATWGTSSTTDRIYCYNNRPITYWLVGVVGSKWFTNFKGEPQLRVNIGLRLPYKEDDAFAKKIYKLARPAKKDEDIPDLVYASKYMARQVRGSADAVAAPFKDVYDAQLRFRSKREMCNIPPSYISKNDLVLVEAFLTRWNTAKDKKGKAEWTSWDVGFELQAVSLLFEAPAAADEHEYGPADNIRDDM